MEAEASKTKDQITDKGNEKHPVMAVSNAAGDTFVPQKNEHEVCEGIDDFGAVNGKIVILSREY